VLKEDAEDVVELMQESMRQVHMDETGQIDVARGGVRGKSKKNRVFLDALRKKFNEEKFTFEDMMDIAEKGGINLDGFKDFVYGLQESGDILRGAGKTYYLPK
jgi:DNA replicative helicase MCM subunit Mcm2 (Cdc46/Mcm family)